MREARKLSLKRERLTELTSEQLDGLAGGLAAAEIRVVAYTIACTGTQGCPSDAGNCSTLDGTCSCGCTYRDICGNAAIYVQGA